MRNYELVFIVHPELEETAFQEIVQKVQSWITDGGGEVTQLDIWGKQKLKYPIKRQQEGQYVLVKAQMPPALCSDLERNLRLTEQVLRFLLIVKD
ncbi:MAG: 30S ribosomal protein S6 [Chloroflexota bacterium]